MRFCSIEGCDRPFFGKGYRQSHYQKLVAAKKPGAGYASRSFYFDPVRGAVHDMVPEPRRCRGCRGWATHRFVPGSRTKVNRGYPVCLDCAALWGRYGVAGRVFVIEDENKKSDMVSGGQPVAGTKRGGLPILEGDAELAFSFIQIGSDPAATTFLKKLDDDLVKAGAKFDIVDAKTADDMETMSIQDILLAAVND